MPAASAGVPTPTVPLTARRVTAPLGRRVEVAARAPLRRVQRVQAGRSGSGTRRKCPVRVGELGRCASVMVRAAGGPLRAAGTARPRVRPGHGYVEASGTNSRSGLIGAVRDVAQEEHRPCSLPHCLAEARKPACAPGRIRTHNALVRSTVFSQPPRAAPCRSPHKSSLSCFHRPRPSRMLPPTVAETAILSA